MADKPKDVKVELDALIGIIMLLESLTKEERERILRYVRDKFGVYMGEP